MIYISRTKISINISKSRHLFLNKKWSIYSQFPQSVRICWHLFTISTMDFKYTPVEIFPILLSNNSTVTEEFSIKNSRSRFSLYLICNIIQISPIDQEIWTIPNLQRVILEHWKPLDAPYLTSRWLWVTELLSALINV